MFPVRPADGRESLDSFSLTDAWVKRVSALRSEKALKAYAHEAMNKGPWGGANGRVRWKDYYQLGYIPYPNLWDLRHRRMLL